MDKLAMNSSVTPMASLVQQKRGVPHGGEVCKQQGIARVVDGPTHAWRGCCGQLENG
jgi:hypothetical protein